MPDSQAATFCTKTRKYLNLQVVERDFSIELLGEGGDKPTPRIVGPSRPQRDNEHRRHEHEDGDQDDCPSDDGSNPGHERSTGM